MHAASANNIYIQAVPKQIAFYRCRIIGKPVYPKKKNSHEMNTVI